MPPSVLRDNKLNDAATTASEQGALDFDLALPLVINLDGTLISTDALHESLVMFLKRRPLQAWKIVFWAMSGRAVLKRHLADAVTDEDANVFPVNDELVAVAASEASRGRRVVLATAAARTIADRFQRRFPFIDHVIASGDQLNLRGVAKATEVSSQFPDGFLYAGDSSADLYVWSKARAALFVGHSAAMEKKIAMRTDLAAVLPTQLLDFPALRKGLRLHQWAKNALVFVPLVLGGKAGDQAAWFHAFEGFLALSILASATYLLNDLWDLTEDRRHWSKRHRPLASGRLSIMMAILFIAVGVATAFGLAATLSHRAVFALLAYLSISLAYSFRLKREPMVDMTVLASMFTMRLAIGVIVSGVAFSPWLFVFSMFIFLSLSAAKRQTEITRMVDHGLTRTLGRGYRAEDATLVLAVGVAAMVATALITVIYLVQEAFPAGVYHHPAFLWGFPIIVFLWLSRIWLLCHRGQLNDDPVAFALKDRLSLGYGAASVALIAAALI